jgi:hypothetical protein
MTGLLQTIETSVGQTIGLIRENGQVEDCTVVPGGASIGGAASAVYFVDQGAAAGGNGSIGAPFNTFAAAFAAAAADATTTFRPQVIWCVPASYAAEGPQTSAVAGDGFVLTVVGWNIGIAQVLATGPTLPNITLTGAGTIGVNLVGCNIGTLAVATGEVTLASGSVAATVTCDVLKARDSQLGAGGWTATTSADFSNCQMGAGAGVSPSATFRNCPQPSAPVVVTGAVLLDGYTAAWSAISGTTTAVANGSRSEVISVVVPAVVAGSVGYVDVTMVGALATVPADAPVYGAPQVDLVAAGVGGGFINCRAAALATIRCAFLGPLAGGAVNFTFGTPALP